MKITYLVFKITSDVNVYGCLLKISDNNWFLIEHDSGIMKGYPYYWYSRKQAKKETLKKYRELNDKRNEKM